MEPIGLQWRSVHYSTLEWNGVTCKTEALVRTTIFTFHVQLVFLEQPEEAIILCLLSNIMMIVWFDNVNWPTVKRFEADVSNIRPGGRSSEQIDTSDSLLRPSRRIGLTLETSAFAESLYGGQITLSTQLIRPCKLSCYAPHRRTTTVVFDSRLINSPFNREKSNLYVTAPYKIECLVFKVPSCCSCKRCMCYLYYR